MRNPVDIGEDTYGAKLRYINPMERSYGEDLSASDEEDGQDGGHLCTCQCSGCNAALFD